MTDLGERIAILEYKMNILMEKHEKEEQATRAMLQNEIAKRDRRIKELETEAERQNATSSTS